MKFSLLAERVRLIQTRLGEYKGRGENSPSRSEIAGVDRDGGGDAQQVLAAASERSSASAAAAAETRFRGYNNLASCMDGARRG